MTESYTSAHGPADGEQAMARLADRIATLAPPSTVLELDNPAPAAPPPRFSPAVSAALDRTASLTADRYAEPYATTAEPYALSEEAEAYEEEAPRRRRSIVATAIAGFVSACAFIPYALVALVLRLVMARVFFLDGQARIDGPHLAYSFHGFDFSAVLPLQVKTETFSAFLSHYSALPLPPAFAAYLVSGAEFLLPIMLVLGLGTRFAALGLMMVTALIQLFVQPEALWTAHIYWAAILLVLLARGPGPVSFDHVIRLLARR